MLRMDQVHVIRQKILREGTSIRQVARELGLSRNTVSKYLDQSVPLRHAYRRRKRPVWARVQSRLEELVAEWEPRTTAKQRLTGVRLYRALVLSPALPMRAAPKQSRPMRQSGPDQ
jgi:transposase-like protein